MENIIADHKRMCFQNMKVIVHNPKLWSEYRDESEAAHLRELRATPPIKWRPLYVSVGDFKVYYGENKNKSRAHLNENEIIRDDVFIMKGEEIVAQFVDYIGYYKSMDGLTGLSCMNYYKELILGEAGK